MAYLENGTSSNPNHDHNAYQRALSVRLSEAMQGFRTAWKAGATESVLADFRREINELRNALNPIP